MDIKYESYFHLDCDGLTMPTYGMLYSHNGLHLHFHRILANVGTLCIFRLKRTKRCEDEVDTYGVSPQSPPALYRHSLGMAYHWKWTNVLQND